MRNRKIVRRFLVGVTLSLGGYALAQEMTPTEINSAAEANLSQTNSNSEAVQKALVTAQRAGDQDAGLLTRAVQKVDPLVSVSQDARGKVMDYLAVPDMDRALFELRKMDIAAAKVDQFAAEAQKCIDMECEDGIPGHDLRRSQTGTTRPFRWQTIPSWATTPTGQAPSSRMQKGLRIPLQPVRCPGPPPL